MIVAPVEYLWGYESDVIAFLLVALLVVSGVLTRRRPVGSRYRLALATLLVGVMFYQSTALIFVAGADQVAGIHRPTALLTHALGVVWNCLTVLLAVYWRVGRVPTTVVARVVAFGAVSVGALTVCFILLYPGPTDPNYIVGIEPTVVGKVYVAVYAASMLAAKSIVLWVCLPQIRQMSRRPAQVGLALVCLGSAMIAAFAVCRMTAPYWRAVLPDSADVVETVALVAHVVGAIVYAAGFGFMEARSLLRSVLAHADDVRRYLRLRPLLVAIDRYETEGRFGVVSGYGQPRWPEFASRAAISGYVSAAVVVVFDAAGLRARALRATLADDGPSATGGHGAVTETTPLFHFRTVRTSDYRLVAATARDYRTLVRGSIGPEVACARALAALADALALTPAQDDHDR